MDKFKIAKQIKLFSIIGLVAIPIFIVCLVFGIILAVDKTTVLAIILLVAAFIFFSVAGILSIVTSIKALLTDWGCEELNREKTIWSMLGFFILPVIAPLIFSCKAIKFLGA